MSSHQDRENQMAGSSQTYLRPAPSQWVWAVSGSVWLMESRNSKKPQVSPQGAGDRQLLLGDQRRGPDSSVGKYHVLSCTPLSISPSLLETPVSRPCHFLDSGMMAGGRGAESCRPSSPYQRWADMSCPNGGVMGGSGGSWVFAEISEGKHLGWVHKGHLIGQTAQLPEDTQPGLAPMTNPLGSCL